MDYRSVLLVGMLSGAALVGSATSCSGPDPGQVTFSERPRGSTGDLTSGGTSGAPTDGGGSSSGDAEAGTDGGSSGLPVTAFTNAPAFNPAGAAVGTSQNGSHPNGGNPAGVNCMDCHGAAGPANSKWGIAGTLYTTAAGTAVHAAKAEVRIVDSKGTELAKVYSDPLGNFWSDTIVGGIPGGSKVGVRNAAGMKLMGLALGSTDSGCNGQKAGCHVVGAATQGRVFLQ